MSDSHANGLPATHTPFVGRDDEMAEIVRLFADPACRLLTLTGPGGIGKTRLAVEAARILANDDSVGTLGAGSLPTTSFPHGVPFVPLQPLSSPEFIIPAIAEALRLRFYGERDPRQQLLDFLYEKSLLLILDNLEHLLDGAPLLSDILAHAPNVRILATSRERLHLQEEWVLDIGGLRYPTGEGEMDIEGYSAVALFVRHARRVNNRFTLANGQGAAVARVCRLVGGMPLGIELAAAWARALSCEQIAAELERSLDILETPARNVEPRHRTMRAAFEPTWARLSDEERAVFMKLSVFRGGFTREAAEYVAGASLRVLSALVDKSLVKVDAGGRYDLHELLRQYAADRLLDAGEDSTALQRHADYFLQLAENADAHAFGHEQIIWFDQVEADMDNLRAVFTRLVETEAGLRLAAALAWFFCERSYGYEGFAWLAPALDANQDAPPSLRSKALIFTGVFATYPYDDPRVFAFREEALAVAHAANDRRNIAWCLSWLALGGDFDAAQSAALLDESLALFRELGDSMGLTHTLIRRAWVAHRMGDHAHERLLVDEAGMLARKAGDKICEGWVTLQRGLLAQRQEHDLIQACSHYERSLSIFRGARFLNGHMRALILWAEAEQLLGNSLRAQHLTAEIQRSLREIQPDMTYLVYHLALLASHTRFLGQFERAATLLGAASGSKRIPTGNFLDAGCDIHVLSLIAELRAQLGEAAFTEAWAAGVAMTREQAIAYAVDDGDNRREAAPSAHELLTERELEVLRLIADGCSNQEIADQLVLALGTVKWYTGEIFSKLQVTSRTQAVSRARALGVLD